MNSRKITSLLAAMLAVILCLGAATVSLADNAAPQAQNMELETFRDVSVGGRLTAVDPEGDPVTFQITTQPVKGAVALETDGSFVYTPASGKKGKDYFGYKALDAQGNLSQEGTVIIKINRQKAAVTYSDMTGSGDYYAAVMLAKNGVFTGEKVGGTYLFCPEASVTRGEFLSMCMEVADTSLLAGVMSTGFEDDAQIPDWEKPYVSTAVMNGGVCGYAGTFGSVFCANTPITQAEASVMLNKAAGLTDVAVTGGDSAEPAWAAQSVANLRAQNIPTGGTAMTSALTRAKAAEMLLKAMDAVKAK